MSSTPTCGTGSKCCENLFLVGLRWRFHFGKVYYLVRPTPLPSDLWNHKFSGNLQSNLWRSVTCGQNLGNKGVNYITPDSAYAKPRPNDLITSLWKARTCVTFAPWKIADRREHRGSRRIGRIPESSHNHAPVTTHRATRMSPGQPAVDGVHASATARKSNSLPRSCHRRARTTAPCAPTSERC